MKNSVLVLLVTVCPTVCAAQNPAPAKPTPTPRVIILHHEDMRKSLENDRMSLDKDLGAGKIDRGGYAKGMKKYKDGIEIYREAVKGTTGAEKSGSKAGGEKTTKSSGSDKK